MVIQGNTIVSYIKVDSITDMNYQTCTKCLACKPEHQFYFEKRLNRTQTKCKQCVKTYLRIYQENKGTKRGQLAMEKRKAKAKQKPYDRKSPEAKKDAYQAVKRWRDRNRDKATHEAKLSIRLKRSKAYKELWRHVVEHYGNQCLCCKTMSADLCFDHVKPLSQGGLNNITNGQPLCRKCNSFKGHNGDGATDYRPDNGEFIRQLVHNSGVEVDNRVDDKGDDRPMNSGNWKSEREDKTGNGNRVDGFPIPTQQTVLTPTQLQQQRHIADIIAHCPP